VDADGFDDVLVGAYYDSTNGEEVGAAYLVYGPASGTMALSSADAKLTGEVPDKAGGAVDGAGDVNGDSYDDFLIGARSNDTNGDNAGAVYLVIGGP